MNKGLKKALTLMLSLMVVFAFSGLNAFADAINVSVDADDMIDYAGDVVTFTKADGSAFGMFARQEGSSEYLEDGVVKMNYIPKNKTVYGWLHFGKITDEELTKDVTLQEDGSIVFDVSADYCGKGIPVAPIKKSDGGTTSDQYYLCIPAADKLPVCTKTDLTITNNTNMFKAVTASLKTVGDKEYVVMALSGSGYHYLYKGTYYDAVANGENRDNWIEGHENSDGKWEFEIPVDGDESYVPVVALSQRNLEQHDAGTLPLEKVFYPRQFELNRDAATLVTGDFEYSATLVVTNNVSMFKVAEAMDYYILGGPNSNSYKLELDIAMGSASFDQVRIGESEPIAIDENKVFQNVPVTPGELVALQFHSVSKDEWYFRDCTIDLNAKTIVFDPHKEPIEYLDGMTLEESVEYAKAHASVELLNALIKAIQVQERDDDTDRYCATAKACWDALSDEDKLKDDGYFSDPTGDASEDDPLNQDNIGKKELLVVSFGTSFNESRAIDIGGIEKALSAANPSWSVRRAFTAQIIINHVQARDGEKIDNVDQALQRAVDNGVKTLVIQPTHLMHGAEYDELVAGVAKFADKFDSITITEPLLGTVGAEASELNADKEAAAKAVVAETVKVAGAESLDELDAAKTAIVFMGHGTSHDASITYSQMQEQMNRLGYKNVFIGTVEGIPAATALPAVKKAVEDAGYEKVILRPLMVVAGDHANNDMAADEEGSWYYGFVNGGMFEVEGADEPVDIGTGFGADNVTCQIEGMGRIADIQKIYVAHTEEAIPTGTAQDLAITNNTNMFKAVTASLKTVGDKEYVVMALSGTGYHYLYKGTYYDAVANGENRDNWIEGYLNNDGKWEFEIPVDSDESYVPVVAISQRNLEQHDAGTLPLEKVFYPRQFELDRDALSIFTGDYEYIGTLAVTNNVSMFSVAEVMDYHILGGPNSNAYKVELDIAMGSASFDKVRIGDSEPISIDEDKVFQDVPVTPEELVTLEFHSVRKDEWYKRDAIIDIKTGTIVFENHKEPLDYLDGMTLEESEEYARTHASVELLTELIKAIQVQERDVDTDRYCAAVKACWDALSDEDKLKDDGYFSDPTGDASEDDPLNQDNIGENELLVVSFGTSFNDSRAVDIGGIEKALAAANPDWSVRRAFTAQIIINHVQARDGEKIDNMDQALERAVANGVKHLVVQPTHLMHGAEYDEMCEAIGKVDDKFESVTIAEPLLGEVGAEASELNADKEAAAKAVVAETVKVAGAESLDELDAAKTAIVFMGHGTSHDASITYSQMQEQMNRLGYKNVFIGTVEGIPAATALPAVKKAVEDAGYEKVILRPLMVVAGDHANNDMAADEEGSWYYGFVNGGMFEVEGADEPVDIGTGFGADNVTCQIEGMGRIADIQAVYVSHTQAAILTNAKVAAIAELEKKYDPSKYSGAEKTAIEKALADAKAAIAAADSIEAVNTAKTTADTAAAKIKTDEAKKEEAAAKDAEAKKKEAANKAAVAKIKVTIKKPKKAKKAFTAKWKNVKNVTGYEVQYSMKKNFKNAKTKQVKGASKKSVKIKKLKKKKNYYVRVRAYKVIDGKTYYGAWSKSKKVKTK